MDILNEELIKFWKCVNENNVKYIMVGGFATRFADMEPMPKSHLAIVPSQSHVSLMMQTKTISGYLDDFLK